MSSPRLTKATLRERCEFEILHLRSFHRFDPTKGIEQTDGCNRATLLAWGRIEAFKSIMEAFCGK